MSVPVQLISLVFADQTLGIMSLVLEDTRAGWTVFPTQEVVEREIQRSEFGEGKKPIRSWRLISPSELPATREFRAAWRDHGKIVEDISECRKIYKDRLREARKPLLESLDIEYQIADEQGNTARKREVAIEKQRLRDATDDPRIEAAQTVEELRTINPLIKEESAKPDNKKANKK